ncbi:MAG: hypothetical protein Q8N60_02765 [Candidatus Diapherotrites archaeon]|nr:hypothetical protein [Candidatus Diapherotrites archaeon]
MLGQHKRSVYTRMVGALVSRRRKKGKMPFKERVAVVKKALAEGRRRCRRSKDLARAQLYLRLFETAMARLEADPMAMGEFRARRIPQLENRIKAIDAKIQELNRTAQEYVTQSKMHDAKKAWREEGRLSAVKKALGIELQMFKELLNP